MTVKKIQSIKWRKGKWRRERKKDLVYASTRVCTVSGQEGEKKKEGEKNEEGMKGWKSAAALYKGNEESGGCRTPACAEQMTAFWQARTNFISQ